MEPHHVFYLKPGDFKDFKSGFSIGFILLKSARNVRVAGYRRGAGSDEYPVDFEVGEKYPVDIIDPDALIVTPISEGIGKFTLQNINNSDAVLSEIHYATVCFPIILDCDANRDGDVGFNESGKANWTWALKPEGRGAILFVNNDKDEPETLPSNKRSEFAELRVRDTGYTKLPYGLELHLYATPPAARRFAVYRESEGPDHPLEWLLGKKRSKEERADMTLFEPDCGGINLYEPVPDVINLSKWLDPKGETLWVEANQYPGPYFEGLVTIELQLRRRVGGTLNDIVLASDRVVYRIAPWMMIPNTFPVEKVYACKIEKDGYTNEEFCTSLAKECNNLGVDFQAIPPEKNNEDRWIQDEIEFGYSQSPKHYIHVVFDSPRDGGLRSYPEEGLLGPETGHFQLGGSSQNTLDSFGNLEVSPPVTVKGKRYPLGRIIFGGRAYGDYGVDTRQMMPKLRRFLYAQKVQSPIEIYTDWLVVGHVDEIICFIPDPGTIKGFKVLLASPVKALELLKKLRDEGHGEVKMFEGKEKFDPSGDRLIPAEKTVNELLDTDNEDFWKANIEEYQEYINLNRKILMESLDLQRSDFIEIPLIFEVNRKPDGRLRRTTASFPNMINHLMINNTSIVPKPFGPKITKSNSKFDCAFEEAFHDVMPKGHTSIFIDNWYAYHIHGGEIHCATNTRRTPPRDVKWWENLPDGGFNI